MADYTLSVEINGDASDLQNAFDAINNSLSGIKQQTSGGSQGIVGMAKAFGVAQLAVKGVTVAMNAVGSSIGGAISRVDTLNQYPKVLEQMGHSGAAAKESIAALSDGIKGLPTTLNDIAGTTQQMVTIMGDVPKATKSTLALNDAFLASGASQEDASRGLQQYMQMLSVGKVDMESWRTLQETMPYALKRTAEAFGFTGQSATKDFYGALQSGEITMDQFNNKLVELNEGTDGWHNTALEATKGIQTSWQNIKTAITTGVANIIAKFNEWAESNGYGTIYDNLDKIKVAISDVFGYMVEKLPVVLDKIVELTGKFMEFYEAIKPFMPLIMAVVGAFLLFQTAVSIAGLLTNAVVGVTGALSGIGKGISIIKGVGPAFTGLFKVITSGFETILLKGMYAFDGIAKFGGIIKTGLTTAFTALKGVAVSVFGAIKGVIVGAFGIIKSIAITALGALKAGFIKLFAVLAANPIALIIAAIVAVVAALVYAYKNFEGFRELVNNVVTSIVEFFTGLWDSIITGAVEGWATFTATLTEIWVGIVEIARTIWEGFKAVLSAVVDFVVNYFTFKWNLLVVVLTGIWNGIVTVGTTLWNGLKTSITTIVSSLVTIVTTLWNGLKTAVTTIISALKGWLTGAWNGIKNMVIDIANGIKDGAVRAWNTIKDKVLDAVEGAKRNFNKLKNINLFEIGKAIIQSFWNGLKNKFESVKAWLSGIGDTIKSLKGPIEKDRKLLIPEGSAIMEGLYEGLKKEFPNVLDLVSGMADEINNTMSGMGADLNFAASTSLSGVMDVASGETYGNRYAPIEQYRNSNNSQEINLTVVSELDGREVSRATYRYDLEHMERDTKLNGRRRGDL